MPNPLIINVSPKRTGTSMMLANICKEKMNGEIINLYSEQNNINQLLEAVKESNTVIIVGPSYINTYPAETVYLLETLRDTPGALHGQLLYGVIQGGMPYVHTHESGLNLLKCFCRECNMRYQGGFVLGLGAMLNGKPLSSLPNSKKVERAFGEFLNHIVKGEESPDTLYRKVEIKIPNILEKYMASSMNKKLNKKLVERGIDDKQPSPYLK